jgi:hypothetical protein
MVPIVTYPHPPQSPPLESPHSSYGSSSSSMFEAGDASEMPPVIALKGELKEVGKFIPTKRITEFNPKNACTKFTLIDPVTINPNNLNHIYDDMAGSFWFDRDVQRLFIKSKGPYRKCFDSLGKTLEAAVSDCLKMAEHINSISKVTLERNLLLVWERLRGKYSTEVFPDLKNVDEIKEWFNKEDSQRAMESIVGLDLTRSDIEIIPEEVLRIPNLRTVYIVDSKIGTVPHILYNLPEGDSRRIIVPPCETSTFYDGYNLDFVQDLLQPEDKEFLARRL